MLLVRHVGTTHRRMMPIPVSAGESLIIHSIFDLTSDSARGGCM